MLPLLLLPFWIFRVGIPYIRLQNKMVAGARAHPYPCHLNGLWPFEKSPQHTIMTNNVPNTYADMCVAYFRGGGKGKR